MSNTGLYKKVYNFLHNSPLEHITAVSMVHQTIEEEPWFPKEDSRQLIHNVITAIKNELEENSEKYRKLNEIPFKFDDAFEGVCSLRDIDFAKRDEEVSIEEIETNLRKLKLNLGKSSAPYAKKLSKYLKKIKPSDLSWKDPKASQVISYDSDIIQRLSVEAENEYKDFMEPVERMERLTPHRIRDVCDEFVMTYSNTLYEEIPIELSHGNWDESEEVLEEIASGILDIM
ncbi:11525_t:CDS:2 [Entrophospora sp. SA101]|nr:11525_t:CDS:2 [Entrophospora sp. SA101]